MNDIRISLLSSHNDDYMLRMLDEKIVNGIRVSINRIPYAQYSQIVLSNNGHKEDILDDCDFIIFCETLSDLFPYGARYSERNFDRCREKFDRYLEVINIARSKYQSKIIIYNFSALDSYLDSIFVKYNGALDRLVCEFNDSIASRQDDLDDVYVFDVKYLMAYSGIKNLFPGKYGYVARFPYSKEFSKYVSVKLTHYMSAIYGKGCRIVIVDLDNTIWGGVVGDDGVDKIKIGGDFPGNIYYDIQTILKNLKSSGILLAACSKNNYSTVEAAFREREDMPLDIKDFVALKVGWGEKSKSVMDIVAEVGLSPKNAVFIDDNPVERAEVKSRAPDVNVVNLSPEVSMWPDEIINSIGYILNSDKSIAQSRTESYESLLKINDISDNKGALHDFLTSLEMELKFEALGSSNIDRVGELIVKTNQFNTTSIRYTNSELVALASSGNHVFSIRLTDSHGANEIISVVVLLVNEGEVVLKLFLMSCRYLGRGVEDAILSRVYEYCSRKYPEYSFLAEININDRNTPVHDIYLDRGFDRIGENIFQVGRGVNLRSTDHFYSIGNIDE